MIQNRAQEVLYESEAALRLVDQELHQLHEPEDAIEPSETEAGAVRASSEDAQIALILDRANAQIMAVLSRLREGRVAIEDTALGKLHVTQDRIREVASATEEAASDILDACERSTAIVDELDAIDLSVEPDRERAAILRGILRNQLHQMIGALQFQDITSQQLSHTAAVLMEMEHRLMVVAKLFDPTRKSTASHKGANGMPDDATYDVTASTRDAEGRQAVADEIFGTIQGNAA